MKEVAINEVVDWILANRKGDAFRDYPVNKIVEEIKKSIMHGCFRLEFDLNDKIIGVVCGEKFEKAKCILIHDVLTTHPDALKRFWQRYLHSFSEYTLVAGHKGKMKTFYKAKV